MIERTPEARAGFSQSQDRSGWSPRSPQQYVAARFLILTMLMALPAFPQAQQVIDFEEFQGGPLFRTRQPPVTVKGATFTGGQILRNASNDIVNGSSIYGTSVLCTLCSLDITIDFLTPVSQVSFFMLNGDPNAVTYTVTDDKGGQQFITLPPDTSGGKTTVTLAESNITHIDISGSDSKGNFDFAIDNLSFKAKAGVLVDPVPSLMTGAGISTDPATLAGGGTQVANVAADGVTQVVLRIPAGSPGDQLHLTLFDEHDVAVSDKSLYGALGTVGSTPGATDIMVTAASTPVGPMAFAVFQAPVDFARNSTDYGSKIRYELIHIQSSASPGTTTRLQVGIRRPPVFLIHGLWDSAQGWNKFPLLTDARFFVDRANYAYPLSVKSSIPAIPFADPGSLQSILAGASGSSLGVTANAPIVLKQLNDFISTFKTRTSTAAVQADIVAHSMGGLVTRGFHQVPSFPNKLNYGKGPVHKVITIGTPHLGSPLALALLNDANSCIRDKMAEAGLATISTATLTNGAVVAGAIYDLQGDGKGGRLSLALLSLKSTFPIPFPTAMIAATMDNTNKSGLASPASQDIAAIGQAICPGNPLVQSLTPAGWDAFLGGFSDGIVPTTSELNNKGVTSFENLFFGVVHSPGAMSLGFNGPIELDTASGISDRVVALLNQFLNGPDYGSL